MSAISLTPRQQRFVAEYLKDLNATKAAARAGFSKRTANQQGSRLLANVGVSEAIRKGLERRREKATVTADRVVEELAVIAFSDLGEAARWGPTGVKLLDSKTLEERVRRAIESVGETGSGKARRMTIKQHSKTKALELLGRHLGMFVDRQEHTFGEGGLTVEIVAAPGAPAKPKEGR